MVSLSPLSPHCAIGTALYCTLVQEMDKEGFDQMSSYTNRLAAVGEYDIYQYKYVSAFTISFSLTALYPPPPPPPRTPPQPYTRLLRDLLPLNATIGCRSLVNLVGVRRAGNN